MKKIVFFLFILAVAVLIFTVYSVKDFRKENISIANEINAYLLSKGLSGANIGKSYRREIRQKNQRWYVFHKQIKAEYEDEWLDEINKIALSKNCTVERKEVPEGIEINIKGNERLYYRIVFKESDERPPTNRIAIVIDDLGYKDNIEEFLQLGIPLTFAIMPGERYSLKLSERLKKMGAYHLLHFPMEPEDPMVNPGKNAVFLRMTDEEIKKQFHKNLKSVPWAFGVSNHMGSGFSKSEEKMKYFLSLVKQEGLEYFDSLTTPKSQARAAGRSLGMKVLHNEIFLDVDNKDEEIEKRILQLLKTAKRDKITIAIGHIHNENLPPLIKKYLPDFEAANIKFVSLKELYAPSRK